MTQTPFDSISPDPRLLTLNGPADLVAAVPYLLGFTPMSSIVAVLLGDADHQVVLTIRADLPSEAGSSDGGDGGDEADYVESWAQCLAAASGRNQVSRMVLAAFIPASDDGQPFPEQAEAAAMLLARLGSTCESQDLFVYDQLLVWADRWRSILCTDPGCCPPTGSTVDQARADRVAAEFIVDGVCVQRDRDAHVASLEPLSDDSAEALAFRRALELEQVGWGQTDTQAEPEPAGGSVWRRQVAEECVRDLAADTRVNPRVVLALSDSRIRDAVIRMLTHDASADHRMAAEQRLIDLVRVAPQQGRAPAASIAAGLAWQRGDGATAQRCLQVALAADPGYSLARLLEKAVRNVVPPSVWVAAVGDCTVDECLTGSRSSARSA